MKHWKLLALVALAFGPLSANDSYCQDEPENFRIMVEKWSAAADPNIAFDVLKLPKHYYLGGGKVLDRSYIMPGFVLDESVERSLSEGDKERVEEIWQALPSIASSIPPLEQQLGETASTYSYAEISFVTPSGERGGFRVVTLTRLKDGTTIKGPETTRDIEDLLEILAGDGRVE